MLIVFLPCHPEHVSWLRPSMNIVTGWVETWASPKAKEKEHSVVCFQHNFIFLKCKRYGSVEEGFLILSYSYGIKDWLNYSYREICGSLLLFNQLHGKTLRRRTDWECISPVVVIHPTIREFDRRPYFLSICSAIRIPAIAGSDCRDPDCRT